MDEPAAGLNSQETLALSGLIQRIRETGITVVLVEHDMELVMRICDFIYVLDFGDIIAAGTPEEIRKDPMVQAAYLGTVTDTEADTAAEAFDTPESDTPDVAGQADEGADGRGDRHDDEAAQA